jgi:general secretion pathway protein H
MTPIQSADCATAGYTLLELLVVVAIMAVVATIAFPPVGRGSDRLRLDAAVHGISDVIRSTRAAAILRDQEAVVVIDADAHSLSSSLVPARGFASDISITAEVADPERLSPTRGGIRFYPDGTSTGANIRLSLHQREARICVNWLTGEPRLAAICERP